MTGASAPPLPVEVEQLELVEGDRPGERSVPEDVLAAAQTVERLAPAARAQVAPGEPVEGEPAPDAAGKNARRLVQEVSGRRLSRKLFHAPMKLNTPSVAIAGLASGMMIRHHTSK